MQASGKYEDISRTSPQQPGKNPASPWNHFHCCATNWTVKSCIISSVLLHSESEVVLAVSVRTPKLEERHTWCNWSCKSWIWPATCEASSCSSSRSFLACWRQVVNFLMISFCSWTVISYRGQRKCTFNIKIFLTYLEPNKFSWSKAITESAVTFQF